MWFCFRICVVKTSKKYQYSDSFQNRSHNNDGGFFMLMQPASKPAIIEYNNEASNIKDIFWNKTNKKSAQLTK